MIDPMDYVCIRDYQLPEEAGADRAKLHDHTVHGDTIVGPSESTGKHPLNIVIAGSWCLLVRERSANKAREFLGIPLKPSTD